MKTIRNRGLWACLLALASVLAFAGDSRAQFGGFQGGMLGGGFQGMGGMGGMLGGEGVGGMGGMGGGMFGNNGMNGGMMGMGMMGSGNRGSSTFIGNNQGNVLGPMGTGYRSNSLTRHAIPTNNWVYSSVP